MTEKELKKIKNDLIIASTIITTRSTDEKYDELIDMLEKERLIKYESDLNFSACNLMEFALENEQYEAAAIIDKVLKRLNENDK